MNSSPFCVITGRPAQIYWIYYSYVGHIITIPIMILFTNTGIVGVYLLLHITLLVTFHAVGLSWGIIFPFHYRKFKADGRIKYIHATTIVLGLVLPAIPALLHLIEGYTIGIDLRSSCNGRNKKINYSLIILPISILGAVTASVFAILLWKIFKVISRVLSTGGGGGGGRGEASPPNGLPVIVHII